MLCRNASSYDNDNRNGEADCARTGGGEDRDCLCDGVHHCTAAILMSNRGANSNPDGEGYDCEGQDDWYKVNSDNVHEFLGLRFRELGLYLMPMVHRIRELSGSSQSVPWGEIHALLLMSAV